ncbi:histidine kinase [Gordonia sp. ABSL11-1]|uniref:sensor histidine kinase n=1 Tax=Gordonia sp. ABSL11-1 TaxID=3053924 RepID=UPI002574411F|nr:histidine kinase [Gordonia sp. ABSL11-1]MDL9947594.1 histidine kinase [Gordonia sp. ABSL11-1]
MRPEDYQPTLTWWSHIWRLILMLVISGIVWGTRLGYQWEHALWWFALDLGVGVLTYLAVWWRRSHPVAVATVGNLASMVSTSSAGAGALAMVSLSTRRHWHEIVPQVGLALVCGVVAEEFFNVPDVEEPLVLRYGIMVAVIATMVAWGMYIGSRRELLASWRARAMLAEAERDAEVRQARSVERARIAREMHDVLAHRISTISMYAGALSYRDDLDRGQIRETAQTIRETSHRALTELREVLGVLREGPGDADPEQPQALPEDLEVLVDENRASGMRIEYHCSADLTGMSPARFRTLYRCLQEALTNARKHAPASTVTVRIKGDEESGVDLLVDNPLLLRADDQTLPRSGLGLVGVAERVALSGGRQSALRTDDRHFVLHVWLPWQS